MRKVKTIRNNDIYIAIILCVIVFLINFFGIIFLKGPAFSDETGTLMNVEYLVGSDWSHYTTEILTGYYKYGSTILYLPLYYIFEDRTLLYQGMLCINSLMVSLIPGIVFYIERKFMKIEDKKLAMGCAVAIGLLPASMIWSKTVFSDPFLTVNAWVILLLLLQSMECEQKWKRRILAFFIGFTSVWAYMAHVRGLVITILVLMVIVISRVLLKLKLVDGKGYILGLFGGVSVEITLGEFLKSRIWKVITYNSVGTLKDAYKEIGGISLSGIKALIRTICGWLYNLVGSSYGLAIAGIIILTGILFSAFVKKEQKLSQAQSIIYIFSLLYICGSFCAGLIFILPGTYKIFYGEVYTRLDQLIYGRYVMGAVGPLMLVAFYELLQKKVSHSMEKKIASVIIGINIIFVVFLSDYFKASKVAYVQLSSLPVFTTGMKEILIDSDLIYKQLVVLAIIISVLAIGFVYIKLECVRKMLPWGLSVLFILTYVGHMADSIIPINRYYSKFIDMTKEFVNVYEINPSDCEFIVKIDRGKYPFIYQMPEYRFEIVDDENLQNVVYIYDDLNRCSILENGAYYKIEDDSDFSKYIIIKGTELKNRLEEKGMKLKRITGSE